MRISFGSSHVHGDYSSGLLTVAVRIEDDSLGQTTWDEIEFAVPPDFRTHNDAVAAALMTLAGRKYQEVEFNFPISPFCVETLRAYYGEIDIGPIDPSATPRPPGRRLAVNFSGGVDSTAVWLLLQEMYGEDFVVITSEYGPGYEFEARNYRRYRRDVSCRTNLRERRFDREGRFNFCVPLLFADYLDLGSIITGHNLPHTADGIAPYGPDERPAFLTGDLVVNAGGLADVHLLRPLSSVGVAMILMSLGRDRIEDTLASSSPPGGCKPFTNWLIFRRLYQDTGLPLPPYLLQPPPIAQRIRFRNDVQRFLYLVKRDGAAAVARYCEDVARYDLRFLADLSLDFLSRYNTRLIDLTPEPLRTRAIELFHARGIEPYDQRDWDELVILRRFLKAHFAYYKELAD